MRPGCVTDAINASACFAPPRDRRRHRRRRRSPPRRQTAGRGGGSRRARTTWRRRGRRRRASARAAPSAGGAAHRRARGIDAAGGDDVGSAYLRGCGKSSGTVDTHLLPPGRQMEATSRCESSSMKVTISPTRSPPGLAASAVRRSAPSGRRTGTDLARRRHGAQQLRLVSGQREAREKPCGRSPPPSAAAPALGPPPPPPPLPPLPPPPPPEAAEQPAFAQPAALARRCAPRGDASARRRSATLRRRSTVVRTRAAAAAAAAEVARSKMSRSMPGDTLSVRTDAARQPPSR